MKKLVLLFALIGIVISSQAQERIPVVTYQINSDAGFSNGLDLPNPFYFHVNKLSTNVKDTTGLNLYSYTYTSTDSLDFTNQLMNDSIPELKTYFMTIPEVDTLTLDGMIEKFVKEDLKAKFGDGNVIKKE